MQIANNLIYLRKKHNLNRMELSHRLNMNESIIRAVENGVSKNPRIDTIIKLTKYFEISIDDFVYKNLEATSNIT